jgi:hypothetical protein
MERTSRPICHYFALERLLAKVEILSKIGQRSHHSRVILNFVKKRADDALLATEDPAQE